MEVISQLRAAVPQSIDEMRAAREEDEISAIRQSIIRYARSARGEANVLLRERLEYALAHAPYYQAGKMKLDADAILSSVPPLRKTELQNRFAELICRGSDGEVFGDDLYVASTSGSTGVPTTVIRDTESAFWDTVAHQRIADEYRVSDDDDVWDFGLRDPEDPILSVEPLLPGRLRWKFRRFDSGQSFNDEIISGAVELSSPGLIIGAPSRLIDVAAFLERNKITVRPKVVITTFEQISSSQQEYLSKTFGAPVRRMYGTAETGMAGWDCEEGNLHFDTDCVWPETEPSSAQEDAYRILLTPLRNAAMALLRYETGDLTNSALSAACPCGAGTPMVTSLIGRESAVLYDPEGRSYSPFSVLEVVGRLQARTAFQLQQRDRSHVEVHLAGPVNDPETLATRIVDELSATPQNTLRFVVFESSELKQAATGKINPVLQLI
ncbi:phenylacetate--CoA ligase family protein [Microbacterium oxydans]|uniref:hypothetical protein n=1 Tax=Microbacterium oxydans TaxID=82380 RepID=UPI00366BDB9D